MRNKAYLAGIAGKQKQQSDQKAGNTAQEDRRQHLAGPEPRSPAHLWTGGHHGTPPRKEHTTLHTSAIFQKYISILPFVVSENPEKTQKQARKNSLLPYFALFCHDRLKICHDGGGKEQPGSSRGAHKKGTPPPFGERKECLAPIIFRAIKVEKSSPQENIIFRTKKVEKSQPQGLVDVENFSEIFSGKCFGGKRKPPILWKGGEVLKYERLDEQR